MRYSLSGVARSDLDEIAASLCASDNPNASTRFIAEVDRVLRLLLDHPFAGERDRCKYTGNIHSTAFRSTSITGVDERAICVLVVAVSDQRRRPGYWRNCIEEPSVVYVVALAA